MTTHSQVFGKILSVIFPPFQNKVTWAVIGTGLALAISPVPFWVFLVEVIRSIAWVNDRVEVTVNPNDDHWSQIVGVLLVISGLAYNLLYGFMRHNESKAFDQVYEADAKLYEEFVALLPSTGVAMSLLKNHDFSGSFLYENLEGVREYTYHWYTPEKSFRTDEMKRYQDEFNESLDVFMAALRQHTAPRAPHIQSAVPSQYHPDEAWEWPDHVRQGIDLLNKSATDVFEKHQRLIEHARLLLPV